MTDKRFVIGDCTNCRFDICEILDKDKDEYDEIILTVALRDAEKIIELLEENERLKKENQGLQFKI